MRVERQAVIDSPRNFKVLHQTLCVTAIDFDNQTLFGYTELAILPICVNLRLIKLNCSKECRINRITVQETIDAPFVHDDPFCLFRQKVSELVDFQGEKSLEAINEHLTKAASRIDADKAGGELLIKFPSEIFKLVDEQKLIRVGIDFILEKPKYGLKFVHYPQLDGSSWRDRAPHLYSWKQPDHVTHGAWFPCVDSWSELCTWKIEVSCDTALTAICSGELQDVSYTSDLRRKNYQYSLTVPTPACNIGLCVGVFDIYVHPDMNELSAFCPPQLVPLLKHTCRHLHKVFEFFEELMSSRYPYGSFKIVFVDDLPSTDPNNCLPYSSLIVMHVKCLYHKKIIDQVPITRRAIAYGVANQFFGCYVVPHKFIDRWVCLGLTEYITALYTQRFFGNNELMHEVYQKLKEVTEFESKWGALMLNPTGGSGNVEDQPNHQSQQRQQQQQQDVLRAAAAAKKCKCLNFTCPLLCGTWFREVYVKKSFLVLRILEKKLGKELLLQVMNKILSVCSHCAQQQRLTPITWSNMLLSTESFSKCVSNVTGHDLQSFVDQWVKQGGHAEFVVSMSFNRKRNTIELDVKQDLSAMGTVKYIGPVSVTVQELDGSFMHTLQIDDVSSRHDIQCHSKARRQRKRKIPLWTGEEVDIDLACLDPDSPLLWLRFDPELLTMGRTNLHQPDYQWQYQLRHERDVIAQFQALQVLPKFPSPQSRAVILDIVKNEQCYYRVRCAACFALAHVINKLAGTWTTPPAMIGLFTSLFGSKSCPQIPRLNNFSNFQHYFLAKAIISSMASIRSASNVCPDEIHQFLLFICKFNNNTQNKFYDDHYRANYYEAFGRSTSINNNSNSAKSLLIIDKSNGEQINQIKKMTTELTHALNLEKIKPSYNRMVVLGALKGLMEIQKTCHLRDTPSGSHNKSTGQSASLIASVLDESEKTTADRDQKITITDKLSLWWAYAKQESYTPVRLTAVECIIDFLTDLNPESSASAISSSSSINSKTLDHNLSELVELFKDDADSPLKSFAALNLLKKLTMARPEVALNFKNSTKFAGLLWALLATERFYDSSNRCTVLDLIQRLSMEVGAGTAADRFDTPLLIQTGFAESSTNQESKMTTMSGGDLFFEQRQFLHQSATTTMTGGGQASSSSVGGAADSASPQIIVAADDWMEIKVFGGGAEPLPASSTSNDESTTSFLVD